MNLKSSRKVIKQYIIDGKHNIHQSQNKSHKYFFPSSFFFKILDSSYDKKLHFTHKIKSSTPPSPLKERWNLILLRSLRGAPFLKDYLFSPRVKNIFNDLKIFKIFRAFQKCYNFNDCAFSFQDIRHIRAARDQ